MKLEAMDEFFINRLPGYDEHMLNDVEGCREGYVRMAREIPETAREILDLGCGTGLELGEIFKRTPSVAVTGIDLTKAMLDRLLEKFADKNLNLICQSYFDCDFGAERFDAAVSFESLHHFEKPKKLRLYERVFDALVPGGVFVLCDYMVSEKAEEDFLFAENKRLRSEQGIPEGVFFHFDTPLTVDNELELLRNAGFRDVGMLWRTSNTTLVSGYK